VVQYTPRQTLVTSFSSNFCAGRAWQRHQWGTNPGNQGWRPLLNPPLFVEDTGLIARGTGWLVENRIGLGERLVVFDLPGAGLGLAGLARRANGDRRFVRDAAPPGRLVNGVPTMPAAGERAGRQGIGDPTMALEGAPAGRPVMGDPIMALEGTPPGRPSTGDPVMWVEGVPAGGCALTAPPGSAFVWAGRPVADTATIRMTPSKTSPFSAGCDLAMRKNFVPIIEWR